MTPYRLPYPVPGVVWASLPLPALLIGPDQNWLTTEGFFEAVVENLEAKMAS